MEYQEDIIRLVDLATLVPVLNRYKLLTLTENSNCSCACSIYCTYQMAGHILIGMSKRLRQQLTGEVAALVKNLEAYYQNPNTYNLVAGPRVDPVKFIRLALIKKGKINAEKVENDEFLRQSLHGNSDDIMLSKTKLEIEKILECKGKKLKGKKVLVEGAPGIGKTMLALHLCLG